MTFSIRLQFKNEDVTLVRASNRSTPITSSTAGGAQAVNALEFAETTTKLLAEGEDPADYGNIVDGGLFEKPSSGTTAAYSTESQDGVEYGRFSVDFKTKPNPGPDTAALFQNLTEQGVITFTPEQGVIDLYNLYFLVKDPEKGIQSDTFSFYSQGNVQYGGATATDVLTTYGVYMVGFPAAQEPSYPVKAQVYPTSTHASNSGNTDWLTGPEVSIQRTVDGEGSPVTEEARTFSASSDVATGGYLMESGVIVAEDKTPASGVLMLKTGTYSYTVTPKGDDMATYAAYSGSFTVETAAEGTVQNPKLYAQGKTSAVAQDYTIKLLDGESYGGQKPFPEGTQFDVTLEGNKQTYTVDASGSFVLNTTSGTGKQLIVEKTGYVPLQYVSSGSLGSVNFNDDGTITATGFGTDAARAAGAVNTLKVNQKYTSVTLTTETAPAYITIKADPAGTVTENISMQLPMTLAVGDDKTATVELPDGDYIYTIVAPGCEDVNKKLDVAMTGLQNEAGDTTTGKVIISDLDGNNPTDVTVTEDPSGNTAGSSTADTTQTGTENTEITDDPMYYAVGTWTKNTSEEVTGMKVEVYYKNKIATAGTFGMQFDPNVFSLDGTVTYNSDIELKTLTLPNGTTALNNPEVGSNYHLFQWTSVEGKTIDASAAPVLLASYTLNFTGDVNKDNYKNKITTSTLTSLVFTGSKWYTDAKTYYDTDTAGLALFADQYWRATDAANTKPATSPRLDADKTTTGGFYQSFLTSDDEATGYDTRSQFVYETFAGATALQFLVTSDGTKPIPGATVTIKQKGTDTVLGSAPTDSNGKVSFPVPNTDVDYVITADGYVDATGTVGTDDLTKVQEVTMVANVSHEVCIHDDQVVSIELVGGKAYNGQDYYFTLQAKPGYHWPSDKLPAASELTLKMVAKDGTFESTTAVLENLVWDAATNRYKLPAASIVDPESDSKIVVQVATPSAPVINDTADQSAKVSVTAGNHGSFDYADDGAASTFTGDSTATSGTKMHSIVETLGIAETTSAKYTFKGDGPIDEANQTAQSEGKTYEAYVINKFIVNGAEMTLTDYERITGVVDYQLHGIMNDQSISVTFGKATINGNGTPGTGDDIIEGPIDPDEQAVINLVLSQFGSANTITVGSEAANPATLTGAASQSYLLDTTTTNNFSAIFEGQSNVAQPEGEPVNYVIDTVSVNGVNVNGETADSRWDSASDKLTLTDLAAGDSITVVVTFKPENGDSVFATVQLIRRAGDGSVAPLGTGIWNVGLPAKFTMTPSAGNDLDQIDLQEADVSAAVDVTQDAVKSGSDYIYQTPNLKSGTTVVGYSFKDGTSYHLNMTIQYTPSVTPGSAATVTFTRAADGVKVVYGPGQVGAYRLDKPTGNTATYDFELPAGTWNIAVTKNGYLDYTITGFVIAASEGNVTAGFDGSMDTKVETGVEGKGTVITFGQKTTESAARKVALTIGDATWDGKIIALNDIAQVANGLVATATAGQKERADMDESGSVLTSDMTYVVDAYGARSVQQSYQKFMEASVA